MFLPPLGSAQGTVPTGHEGTLELRLRRAGRLRLNERHRLNVTAIGTRTDDGVSTLVEGGVTLKR